MRRLITRSLLARLPQIGSAREADDPMVYARFFIDSPPISWFVIEGERRGNVVKLHVLEESAHSSKRRDLTIDQLRAVGDTGKSCLARDTSFYPRPLSEVGIHYFFKETAKDWTMGEDDLPDSSPGFEFLAAEITNIILRNPSMVVSGRIRDLSRIILSQLVHRYRMTPVLPDPIPKVYRLIKNRSD